MRFPAAILLVLSSPALADSLPPGSYDVTYRLEVPHVEQFAVDRISRICVTARQKGLPVLSANNPLAKCPAENVRQTADTLTFDILCPGRRNERSEAAARYHVTPDSFDGRIRMVMGGKNMTFVEVQTGRRTGPCGLASAD